MAHVRSNRQRRAVATVEMAIVITLLFILILGIIEYGWMFLKVHDITYAARHGARIGILPYAANSDVVAAVATIMTSAGMGDSGYTVTFSPDDVRLPYPHADVRVTVTVPYRNVWLLGTSLIPTPENIGASVTMAKEGA